MMEPVFPERRMATLRAWPCLVLVVALQGCVVGPNYRAPETAAPTTWSGIDGVRAATQPAEAATQPEEPTTRPARLAEWWRSLNDPVLDGLVDRAVASNLDLRIARARVREARALRGTVAAGFWPQVDAAGGYEYSGSSLNTTPRVDHQPSLGDQARDIALSTAARSLATGQGLDPSQVISSTASQLASNVISNRLPADTATVSRDQNLFRAGFDATWELDVFGGIRRSVEAADAEIMASEESRRDILITLISEVALNYVQLRGLQRRLSIAQENIAVQQDTVQLTEERHHGGFATALDVSEARAQLASTQSQVPLLRSAIRQSIHQLSVLQAVSPATLLPEIEQEGPLPPIPPGVPIGLPSELLRRRPDIRAAERFLAAASARIGAATADLFPRFSLTGSFGTQSRTINRVLDGKSLTWSVGPAMSWPILDGGQIRANIEVENARQEQALASYERTVLTAFQEVENALVAYTHEQLRRDLLAQAVAASRQSVTLSKELYPAFITFLNVLDSQRTLYITQDQLVQSETAVITNLIALYKALGGGWEAPGE